MPQLPAAPSWGPWAGAGEREPPQNATGLPAVCLCLRMPSRHTRAPRWGRDGGGPCSHTEGLASLSPPQSSARSLGLGPPPCADATFLEPWELPFLSSSLPTDGFGPLPVLPVLGWGRLPDSHHCMKRPSSRLIIIFVENILHPCHVCVLVYSCGGWETGGAVKRVEAGEGLFVSMRTWSFSLGGRGGPEIDGSAAPTHLCRASLIPKSSPCSLWT